MISNDNTNTVSDAHKGRLQRNIDRAENRAKRRANTHSILYYNSCKGVSTPLVIHRQALRCAVVCDWKTKNVLLSFKAVTDTYIACIDVDEARRLVEAIAVAIGAHGLEEQ